MRETKFRFYDGQDMHYPETNYAYELRWTRVTGWQLWWEWENNEKEIWSEFGLTGSYPMMYFTGMKDKNGTDIYTDDIVVCNNHIYDTDASNRKNKVVLHKGCFRLTVIDTSERVNDIPIFNYDATELEIVGNIYQP